MAAALAISNLATHGTATVTLTGDAATTNRTLLITHQDGTTQNISFQTSGAGGATLTFVPTGSGTFTVAVNSVPAQIVSTTAATKHF